ncbi:hypothetical protein FFWV33_12075 [Flavobacterium faecale]|uniref:Acyltransferase 3 domain-containing protein n=1 Tax=Flavobacterium faecale TaxID=1355330 RepID=A0A2S1LEQ8_9FLAO|nr:acyltransferase [Flavobacterium faecale]AWG22198.1 hypothetical protein FFWV33_12075 [Flavobacterium faecale]
MKKYFYATPTFSESTWAILAVTRFLLAFIVMYSHFYAYVFGFNVGTNQFIIDLDAKAAVMAFLLISGISIGYSYDKNKKGFFRRRLIRIYPLYFIAVLFGVVLQYYLNSPFELPNTTMVPAGYLTSIANFLLLQGIIAITIPFNGPLWSIGVEFLLYLMVPFLSHLRLRYLVVITLISMIAIIFFNHSYLYGYTTLLWAWPFIIGLIITVKKQPSYAFILLGLSLLVVNFQNEVFRDNLSVVTASVSIIICLLAMYAKLNFSTKTKNIFNYLGMISYPLYVFHLPLFLLMYSVGLREQYLFISLVILLCIPINYIFDTYLTKIFWKPMILKVENIIKKIRVSCIETIVK